MSRTFLEISAELNETDADALTGVAARLHGGAVVGLPTETVYGLCASVERPDALARLALVKGRDQGSPFSMFLPSLEAAREWAEIPDWAEPLLEDVWPGPLTVVLPASRSELRVLGAEETVGIRVPSHPIPQRVLAALGTPIAATSANRSGDPPLLSAESVRAEFGLEVDVVVRFAGDGSGRASTLVDLSGGKPVLLRPGEITEAQLAAYLREGH